VLVTPVTDDAEALLHATRASGYEGIVAKRTGSTYVAGRRPSWVKVKHRREQEVVVGGYLVGNGLRATTFGSLLVGVHEGGHLRFAGGVGTGFDDRTLRSLRARLDVLVRPDPPFEPAPVGLRGRAVWLQPDLVVQVAFAEWTDDGHLRHPVYLGLRDDRPSRSVVREP
jgi:bifunctional non-homologous end joining protein LigD